MKKQRWTIRTASQALRAGEFTAAALVGQCLERIDELEAEIHAWVSIDRDEALREAAALDRLAKLGDWRGPLHGVPIGVKDIVDLAGRPTKAGSPLRERHVAAHDADVVASLRRAGAVVLGKTVTTEFACFDPPPTRNPWRRDRTPGGSSSGSAAAVASGMCLAAVGSQTGGSIIRPASYCGIAGFKPSHGLVSGQGVVPLSYHLDHVGPLANDSRDLLIMFGAMGGFDQEGMSDAQSRLDALEDNPVAPCEFVRLREYFENRAENDMTAAIDAATDALRQAGATIHEGRLPPSFSQAHVMHRRIMAVEAAEFHRESFATNPQGYSRHIRQLLDDGMATRAVDYAEALAHQRFFRTEMQSLLGDRIALMPATATTAPGIETTGDPGFNSPWSLAGLPAGVIPCSLANDGLPCGLQFLGGEYGDIEVLLAMHWAETVLSFPHFGTLQGR